MRRAPSPGRGLPWSAAVLRWLCRLGRENVVSLLSAAEWTTEALPPLLHVAKQALTIGDGAVGTGQLRFLGSAVAALGSDFKLRPYLDSLGVNWNDWF